MSLSLSELLVIAAVAAVIFGYKKLPEMAKHLGGGIRGFKKAMSEPDEIDIMPKNSGPDDDKTS